MIKYPNVSTIKTSNERKVRLSINNPACVKSSTPISEITPVVRKMNKNWLDKAAYIFSIVCGKITFLKVCQRVRPRAIAASYCPRAIAEKPLLRISAK